MFVATCHALSTCVHCHLSHITRVKSSICVASTIMRDVFGSSCTTRVKLHMPCHAYVLHNSCQVAHAMSCVHTLQLLAPPPPTPSPTGKSVLQSCLRLCSPSRSCLTPWNEYCNRVRARACALPCLFSSPTCPCLFPPFPTRTHPTTTYPTLRNESCHRVRVCARARAHSHAHAHAPNMAC